MLTPVVPVKLAPKLTPADPLKVMVPVATILALMAAVPEFVSSNVPAELMTPLLANVVEVISILPTAVVIAAVEIAAPFSVRPLKSVTAPPIVIAPAVPELEVSILKV